MARYSKLIAAAVGVAAIILVDYTPFVSDGTTTESVTQTVLGILTALGVYSVKNEG